MMKVIREDALRALSSVRPGLDSKESVVQSTCLVFTKGRVHTFNGELACSIKSPFGKFEGAVEAEGLLGMLEKYPDETIDFEQDDKIFKIKGKKKETSFPIEAVNLPIEVVEEPGDWEELPDEFEEAVKLVWPCSSTEESEFKLTCIHCTSTFIESTDRFQLGQYPLDLPLFEEETLIRASSAGKLCGYGMVAYSVTDSWVHFKNKSGLIISCHQFKSDYKDTSQFLETDGMKRIQLPGGLQEVVARAHHISSTNVLESSVIVKLMKERVIVEGKGTRGHHREMEKITFEGEPMEFHISPRLINEVSKKSNTCLIGNGRMIVDTGKFKYLTVIAVPEV